MILKQKFGKCGDVFFYIVVTFCVYFFISRQAERKVVGAGNPVGCDGKKNGFFRNHI